MTTSDKLKRLAKLARRVTTAERMEANLRLFERFGLDIDDVETMAESVGLETEDLLLLDTCASISVNRPARSGDVQVKKGPGRKPTMHDVADFAFVRWKKRMPWLDILHEWRKEHPHDKRNVTLSKMQEAYYRKYRGRGKTS